MDTQSEETLSALIDGEEVDPDVLEVALQDPEAIPFLVNSVRLRLEVQAWVEPVDPEAKRRCLEAVRAETARLERRPWPRLVLAAVVTAAVAASWCVGVEVGGRRGPWWGATPPAAPTAVTSPSGSTTPRPEVVPAGAGPQPAGTTAAGRATEAGPSRTLRFTPARNWHEGRAVNDGS